MPLIHTMTRFATRSLRFYRKSLNGKHISKSLCAVERCGALYNAYSPTARSMLDSSSQLRVCCGALH
ncbi:hypothetical protein PAXRUDRAFT_216214, partial [Paxillus rubicundulus Ve08.2h10]